MDLCEFKTSALMFAWYKEGPGFDAKHCKKEKEMGGGGLEWERHKNKNAFLWGCTGAEHGASCVLGSCTTWL